MTKFATRTAAKAAISSPITSTGRDVTHEGGTGYARDAKSELFLLAVTNMVGEDTFYEQASDRDRRFVELVHAVTVEDPEWVARFVPYLRAELSMRSASVVVAAESAKARLEHGIDSPTTIRTLVSSALNRADEPAEMLAYWQARHGRKLPAGVKRGVADATSRLVNEYAALKYDGTGRAWRLGDVVDLVHPEPSAPWQSALFRYLLDRRHNREDVTVSAEVLPRVAARLALDSVPVDQRRALLGDDRLATAGVTWEWLAGWLQGPMDREAWESVIPSMGYMALLRNLRNFDEAGVSDEVAAVVGAKLADPEQVAKSRQLPMRFLAAYRAAPSLRWSWPLEQALQHAVANVPTLPGRTLILVDTSSSMNAGFSKDGKVMRWDAAVAFGLALAARCEYPEVVSFSSAQRYWGDPAGTNTKAFALGKGESLLAGIKRWDAGGWFLGGGTDTLGTVRKHYKDHTRVVILTDEQAEQGDVGSALPASTPLYTWNLAGYRVGHAPSGRANRHTFGGLTDAAFRQVPLIEAGRSADWPF